MPSRFGVQIFTHPEAGRIIRIHGYTGGSGPIVCPGRLHPRSRFYRRYVPHARLDLAAALRVDADVAHGHRTLGRIIL